MGKKEEIKKEDVVQAVVVADSFSSNFTPLSESTPTCLLPLSGRPLIEYTFENLAMSGVQDVILYLTTNSAKVKSWLASSHWSESHPASQFTVSCITNEDCRSFGDGMRDLYEKGVLRHDFILVSGDLVSNIDLAPYVKKHKERFSTDKHCIMTGVYTQVPRGHPLRTRGSNLVIACHKKTEQIVFYQKDKNKAVHLPLELFQHDEIEVVVDVLDPSIYVCSPIVLALFSDNFDIQDMDTLINEILESELVDSTIYMSSTSEGFASRVTNPYLYMKVNEKLLNRWAFPFVPERRRYGVPGKVSVQSNNIYRGNDTQIERGSVLQADTYIGHRCKIAAGSEISGSSIEADSVIGTGARVTGCIVMEKCQVGANCSILNSIVGENSVIPENSVIENKVIIGHNVELSPNTVIPANMKVAAEKADDGFSDDEEEGEGTADDRKRLGPKAFLYTDESDDEESDQEKPDSWGELYASADDTDSQEDESDAGSGTNSDWGDEEEGEEEDGDEEKHFDEHDDVKNFRREVTESLVRAMEEGVNTDNLVLEINSSKHAWNTTLSEVNHCVITSVLTLKIDWNQPPAKLLTSAKSNIKQFQSLLLKYSKSKSGQDYYLDGLVDLVVRFPTYMEVIAKVLHVLYELDILSDSSILSWAAKLPSKEGGKDLAKKIQPFLDWLEESDSGSDEDEDD